MRVIYRLSVVSGLWDSKGFYIIDGGRKISSLKKKKKYFHEPQNFATQYKARGSVHCPVSLEGQPGSSVPLGEPC